ncbi:hypothetical protein J437_LFUL019191 [Ladona fulva]|uniref:Reverse transcriptase domain-containing protein n=1 Tax=Ladona fulva TaxID=123851 RepID=A0A8K0P4S4_LADFU|nr:hypothetical protein J437_LFUL019191 [Ladona fulva]
MSLNCLGLLSTPVCTTQGVTSFVMKARNNNKEIHVSAIIIPKITSNQPSFPIPDSVCENFSSLDLADPNFYKPGPIDFLLGADLYSEMMTEGPILRQVGLPSAWPSVFGYILLGPMETKRSNQNSNVITFFTSIENDLSASIQKFWSIEELPTIHSMSPEDRLAEQQFRTLHYRNPDGSYVVPLLLKDYDISLSLGDSKMQTIRRFTNLERKFKRDPELHAEYTAFLKEYLTLGHMSLAEWGSGKYYIPHHAVVKPYSRPKLQKEISDLIIRFRLHPVALVADIYKMYRMIHLLPQHSKYQHIVWRSSEKESLQVYRLNTVTYGLTSSPYLALRTLKQLSEDEADNFPKAASVLSGDFFVDDLLTGASSELEAIELIKKLQRLLRSGGFQLRKWSSNISHLFLGLPIGLSQSDIYFLHQGDQMKVLGIHWEPSSDTFSYHISRISKASSTKKSILSTIAKLFDPLG